MYREIPEVRYVFPLENPEEMECGGGGVLVRNLSVGWGGGMDNFWNYTYSTATPIHTICTLQKGTTEICI